jgi:hypothetical protein
MGTVRDDWSALYAATWHSGKTTLQAIDPTTGNVVHQTILDDRYYPDGLSPVGRWLVMRRQPSAEELDASAKDGKSDSRFLVLDHSLAPRPGPVSGPITLDGDFWFVALDRTGSVLFLIENRSRASIGTDLGYAVRLYDLKQGRLQPDAVADKTGAEVLQGFRQSPIASPDGAWLYTLNLNQTTGPFLHALNLDRRAAVRIDLPPVAKDDFEKQLLWTTTMSHDGKTLYAANGALGIDVAVDLTRLQVARTGRFAVA